MQMEKSAGKKLFIHTVNQKVIKEHACAGLAQCCIEQKPKLENFYSVYEQVNAAALQVFRSLNFCMEMMTLFIFYNL